MKQNLIRIMTDSAQLAEEPEFTDLYLDGEKTARVTERWLKKYEKRLAAAEKKGSDEYHELFDEMHIEVIAELATPAFRRDVDQRLQTLLDRLMTTNDLAKLEMAIWFRTRQKWAAALQSELAYLDGDQYEENKFVLAAFIGQLYRIGKEHKSVTKTKKRH